LKTYIELWSSAQFFYETAKAEPRGSAHQFKGCVIFAAFTFEAYLNHVGALTFKNWDSYERKLGYREKLGLIDDKLKFGVDHGKPPFQVIDKLFKVRNAMAHGKTELLNEEKEVHESQVEQEISFLLSEWEEYSNEKNVEKVMESVENAMKLIWDFGKKYNSEIFKHVWDAHNFQMRSIERTPS